MRLFLLTALTMVAFAANSLLNRAGVLPGSLSAESFGVIRLWAGAVMLGSLVLWQRGGLSFGGSGRVLGVASLMVYIFGFSFAYNGLDAGAGALILFGMVQVTMFGGGLWSGERPPVARWAGAGLAFAGLVWLLWPGQGPGIGLAHGAAMAAAGVGWGIYSLVGRGAVDALQSTAANFILAAVISLALFLVLPLGTHIAAASWQSVGLAVVSGAVTSGLGYALWYSVLPQLPRSVAAVAQLTVPVIAMAGGALFLGEALGLQLVLAAAVVLGGVSLSVLGKAR